MTKTSTTIMYASAMSRETVRIAPMTARLYDTLNAYVQAPVTEKIWTTFGPEFSKDASKTVVIIRVLCNLKSAGAVFRTHHARCLESLDSEPTLLDEWNPWDTFLVRPTQIYGLNQKSDQRMG